MAYAAVVVSADFEFHAQVARAIYPEVRLLAAKPDRSPREEQWLVHSAHAFVYHFMEAGDPVEEQRGEWLVSHVYSRLGRGEEALRHADRCMELFEVHRESIGTLGEAYAFEALARAHTLLGNRSEARTFRTNAEQLAHQLQVPEVRAELMEILHEEG